MKKNTALSFVALCFFAVCLYLVLVSVFAFDGKENEGVLQVTFLDVGQGDSIFIQTPSGKQVLVDGGAENYVLQRELGAVLPWHDTSIDLLIPTHPDKDHIGGLEYALDRFSFDAVLQSRASANTATAKRVAEDIVSEAPYLVHAQRGQIILLDGEHGVVLEVLSPFGDVSSWSDNDASTVVRLVYKNFEILLSGDAGTAVEEMLISSGSVLQSDVLKLGHHGSKTSTSAQFLDAVSPQYAIVSAGRENSYGHPHQEVLDIVLDKNIAVLSTAEEGSITIYSNGEKFWFEEN
jgi:competence protein ComEC